MSNSLYDEFAFLGFVESECVDNSLYEWCMNHGDKGKQILDEWNHEKNVNEYGIKITPRDVKRGSDKRAWWKCCRCGNEYQLPIRWRISYIVGCSKCRTKGSSFSEVVMFLGVQAKFPLAKHRLKCGDKKLEFDIVIPELNTYIEYSGEYWHANSSRIDQAKRDYCNNNNIRFIEIIETNKSVPLSVKGDMIFYRYSEHNQDAMLHEVLLELYKLLDVTDYDVDYKNILSMANDRMLRPINGSVVDTYPQLNDEFDEEINNGVKLEFFTVSSAKRIKWKCTKCKNTWSSTIANRTEFRSACPCCGYNIFDGKMHTGAIRKNMIRIIPGAYSL